MNKRPTTYVQQLSELEPKSQPEPPPQPKRFKNIFKWRGYRNLRKDQLILVGLIATCSVLLLALFAAMVVVTKSWSEPEQKPAQTVTQKQAQIPTTIRLIAAGDFMAQNAVNSNAQSPDGAYNYMALFEDFRDIFSNADLRFCSDAVLNGGTQFGISGAPSFNSPTEFVRDMGRLGCNVVNTASNHSFDKTQDVISASVYAWEDAPGTLAVAGQNRTQAERSEVKYFNMHGVKFALLAYTTYSNKPPQNGFGVNMFSHTLASDQIAEAKKQGADVIIVSMRWGTEFSPAVNDPQKQEAKWLADQGVGLILGQGPFVVQPVEQIIGTVGNKTLVWYSLGNFLNVQSQPEALFSGLAVMDIDTKTKEIKNLSYLPTYIHYEWSPEQAAAQNLDAVKNLRVYKLDDVDQQLLDANQLKTTVDSQKVRLTQILNSAGLQIPLITASDY